LGVIRSIDSRRAPSKPAEAIQIPRNNNTPKLLVTDREKANGFIDEYYRASQIPKEKVKDRRMKDTILKNNRSPCTGCTGNRIDICSPFNLDDLNDAIIDAPKGNLPAQTIFAMK